MLGRLDDPYMADLEFQKAERNATDSTLRTWAQFDRALVTATYGAYHDASAKFAKIVAAKNTGDFEKRRAWLWQRQIGFRAAYRDRNAKLGIPEPTQLSKECGVQALGTALSAYDPVSQTRLRNLSHTTGLGNCIEQLRDAALQLGYSAHIVQLTNKGLQAMRVPIVTFVEHDHFAAILKADAAGVLLACPHCAQMPFRLTWKQWAALEPEASLIVAKKGGDLDRAVELALKPHASQRETLLVHFQINQSMKGLTPLARRLMGQIRTVTASYNSVTSTVPASIAVRVSNSSCYGASGLALANEETPGQKNSKDGDPVNLATGEMTHTPSADLTVYNPIGPSIAWGRGYAHLINNTGVAGSREVNDFGSGWTQPYNVLVYDPDLYPVVQVSQGLSTGIVPEQYDTIGTGLTWQVVQGSTALASSSTPNGWAWEGATITPPATTSGTGFFIRWTASGIYGTSTYRSYFDVVPPYQAAQGNQSVAMAPTGNALPANYNTWDIVYNGTVIAGSAEYSSNNGWFYTTVGTTYVIGAPANATLGSGYTFRTTGSRGGPYSFSFTMGPTDWQIIASPKYLLLPNGSNVAFTPSAVPSSSSPVVQCSVAAGEPFAAEWDYDPSQPNGYYRITMENGDVWTMTPVPYNITAEHSDLTIYNPSRITDRHGNYILFNYVAGLNNSPAPALSSITDSTGRTLLSLTRQSGYTGLITAASDCYGRSVYYSYPGNYNLGAVSQIVATGTMSPPMRYTYTYGGPSGAISAIAVPSPTGTGTSTTSFVYTTGNFGGICTSQTDPNGNQRSYTAIDASHTRTTIKNSAGTTVYSYTVGFDANGNTTTVTDGTNSTIVHTFTYVDPNDPFGISSDTDGAGRITHYTYDQFAHMLTVTTPRGVLTTSTYEYTTFPLGRLTSIQQAGRSATTFTYAEPSGDLLSATGPVAGGNTATVTNTYDSLGNLTSVTQPDSTGTARTTTLAFTTDGTYSQAEALGQPIACTDALGQVSHIRYDAQGRVVLTTDPVGFAASTTYNLAGQRLTSTLPASGQTGTGQSYSQYTYLYPGGPALATLMYDESNHLVRDVVSTYGPAEEILGVSGGSETQTYTYDGGYRPLTVVDGLGRSTQFAYNTAGYVQTVTYPGSETAQVTSYNGAGQPLSATDTLGRVVNYTYGDPDGLVTAINYPASSSSNIGYTYDGYGRASTITDGQGTTALTYGGVDETASKTVQYTGLPAITLSYSYNPDGSRASLTTPAGAVSYNYDVLGRLGSISSPTSDTVSWTYNADDTPATQSASNGSSVAYTYNALKQLSSLQNNVGTTQISLFNSIAHDGAGNLTQFNETNAVASSYSGLTSYSYDSTGQLLQETSARVGGYTNSFTYDASGNPTVFRGASQAYTSKNEVSASGFSYDLAGNPTTYSGSSLTFDANDRLTAFASSLSAGYTSGGMRAWKTGSAGQNYFIYDGVVPVLELDSSGNVLAVNTAVGATPLTRHTSAGSTFYMFDAQGNVAHRLDGSANVLSSHAFDAFGASSATASSTDPYACYQAASGYRMDSETGLLLAGHRYYDPNMGRFLNRDPAGYAGGINQFRYCANNPGNASDPSGLWDGFNLNMSDWAAATNYWASSAQQFYATHLPWGAAGLINSSIEGVRQFSTSIFQFGCSEGKFSVHPTLQNSLGCIGDAAMVFGVAKGGVMAVRTLQAWLAEGASTAAAGDMTVYLSRDLAGNVQYVGITNDFDRRAAEHLAEKGIKIDPIYGLDGLSVSDAKAAEQVLIEQYGLNGYGGQLMNKINSIAASNPSYASSISRGHELLEAANFKF
jgi:RHS repeat-associated protein